MKDKTKIILTGITVGLFVLGILGFGLKIVLEGNIFAGIIALIVALNAVIFAGLTIKKDYERMTKGIPKDDERTISIKMKAGYYAYLVGIYWLLAMLWYNGPISDYLGTTPFSAMMVLEAGILGMTVFFGAFWLYFRGG